MDSYIGLLDLSYADCSSYFFFFKQKTAYDLRISDWSSDVCSSDLALACRPPAPSPAAFRGAAAQCHPDLPQPLADALGPADRRAFAGVGAAVGRAGAARHLAGPPGARRPVARRSGRAAARVVALCGREDRKSPRLHSSQ